MEADEDSIVNEAIDFSSNSKYCSHVSVANPVLLRAGEKKKIRMGSLDLCHSEEIQSFFADDPK